VILFDSGAPRWLVGASHAHELGACRLVEHALVSAARIVAGTAVLEEILRRFVPIDRRDVARGVASR
jgi:hypothetical protein